MYQVEHPSIALGKAFFCCPDGYTGILPDSGQTGICQENGPNIPISRLATTASQFGAMAVTTVGSPPTTRTGGSSGSTTRLPSGTPGDLGSPVDGGDATKVSLGGIAGIVIGAVVLLALALGLVLWLHRRSLRQRPPGAAAHASNSTSMPRSQSKPVAEVQVHPTGPVQYNAQAHVHESPLGEFEAAPVPRAEMEVPSGRP